MKLDNKVSKKDRTGRVPLRTITELAEEFGVTSRTLAGLLANSDTSPSQVFKTGTGVRTSRRNIWYNPAEVRAWWKQFLIDRPDVRDRLGK